MFTERRVGLDFDNTIISYDDVFLSMAIKRGLVNTDFCGRKQAVRDSIRLLPDGELSWQQLQGQVYGKGIADAAMFEGVDSFLCRCRQENVSVAIVSHKTEFGHHDSDRINLRDAARDWMTAHGFFRQDIYAIPAESVYFEETREGKLKRIAALGCTHFIDDLEEVLNDPEFPSGVERILFTEGKSVASARPYIVCPTWLEIEGQVFHARP
jgi:hypothetical protein